MYKIPVLHLTRHQKIKGHQTDGLLFLCPVIFFTQKSTHAYSKATNEPYPP
jgi:hypothetical protein